VVGVPRAPTYRGLHYVWVGALGIWTWDFTIPIHIQGRPEMGELIRGLTRDPTCNYQPLGGRRPLHDVSQQPCTMS
jgi:hypothetical protein